MPLGGSPEYQNPYLLWLRRSLRRALYNYEAVSTTNTQTPPESQCKGASVSGLPPRANSGGPIRGVEPALRLQVSLQPTFTALRGDGIGAVVAVGHTKSDREREFSLGPVPRMPPLAVIQTARHDIELF